MLVQEPHLVMLGVSRVLVRHLAIRRQNAFASADITLTSIGHPAAIRVVREEKTGHGGNLIVEKKSGDT
jgi:hypothetical protein